MRKLTKSPAQTQVLGRRLAQKLKGGEVIGLYGDLGGGKTTFVQGLARGLGFKKRILSPTFVILKIYPLEHKKIKKLYHLDGYRIKKVTPEIWLNFKEYLGDPKSTLVIEWADKFQKFLPSHQIKIKFKLVDEKTRQIDSNLRF